MGSKWRQNIGREGRGQLETEEERKRKDCVSTKKAEIAMMIQVFVVVVVVVFFVVVLTYDVTECPGQEVSRYPVITRGLLMNKHQPLTDEKLQTSQVTE